MRNYFLVLITVVGFSVLVGCAPRSIVPDVVENKVNYEKVHFVGVVVATQDAVATFGIGRRGDSDVLRLLTTQDTIAKFEAAFKSKMADDFELSEDRGENILAVEYRFIEHDGNYALRYLSIKKLTVEVRFFDSQRNHLATAEASNQIIIKFLSASFDEESIDSVSRELHDFAVRNFKI